MISYLFSSNATQSWSNKFLMSINGRGHEDKRELYWCSQRGCGFDEFIRIKIGVWLIQINIEHFHNPLSFINTRVFPFIFYDDIAIDREWPTSTLIRRWWDVETASLRWRITTLMWRRTTSKYRRSDPGTLTSRRQDQHPIDTDKLNSVNNL